ncbi:flagellar biosynthetic protein FliO [Alkalihalobacillus deserti]|uniref:flagellar biosynthetic protein FliO n=1 Tax=Alkalihalobacillus deserti TaxID=2879466 RepID=UPI001D142C2F|nr:flagellar biosynthetic protein FliO [Alkalihalobacillus deserti]
MRIRFLIIALILSSLIGLQHHVEAETTNENRRVNETLKGNDSVEESVNEEAPVVTDPDPWTIDTEPVEDEVIPEQNTFLIFAQMISALALVIVLIYLLLRFLNKRSQSFRSTQMLQNIGGVPLGANRSVQLVKVGNRVLVVGVGESIQLLREIEDAKEINLIVNQQKEQFEQLEQPVNKLFNLVSQKMRSNKPNTSLKPETNNEAFKNLLSKQLKDVSKTQEKLHDAVRERDK